MRDQNVWAYTRPGNRPLKKKQGSRTLYFGRPLTAYIRICLYTCQNLYTCILQRYTYSFTRVTYSPVRVSIRIFSPSLINGGTCTISPVSSVAGLY